MINYVIIGGGWRAEFYLRIAKLVPDKFNVTAICVRNNERAEYIKDNYNIEVFKTIEETLLCPFDFIVNCINMDNISEFAVSLADKGHYVLCETPIMTPPESGHHYEKIQVAEQFHLKGTYQALKKIIDMGIVGEIVSMEISVAHDYHAMSLMRFLLCDYYKPEKIFQHKICEKILVTNGRIGEFPEKKIEDNEHIIKIFKFGKATVVYDYMKEQYFSPIRKDRIIIRGTKGEIENSKVRYFNKNNEYVENEIKTVMSGLLDGFFYDKIIFEDNVLYTFPYKKVRLSEEESAMADCLVKMYNYIKTGKELYPYKKAYEDYTYFLFGK